MKNYFICIIILLVCSFSFTQSIRTDDGSELTKSDQLFVGEDLTYIVKYAFFNLGEVRFKVLEKTKINNTTVYKTIAFIDSYPDLPFVSLHQVYESYIDSSLYPLQFFAKIFDDDTIFVQYNFITNSTIEIEKGKIGEKKLFIDSTLHLQHKMQDGLSIFYFARMNFGNAKLLSIPCFVNEKVETAVLNFYQESIPVSIDAVDYEIDCLRLEGYTDFVSVYGLTGDFEGWFSNDNFSVPIRARMNVIIGSVNLELIKWNEKLWNPPIYKN